jgi:hypothetical protein
MFGGDAKKLDHQFFMGLQEIYAVGEGSQEVAKMDRDNLDGGC